MNAQQFEPALALASSLDTGALVGMGQNKELIGLFLLVASGSTREIESNRDVFGGWDETSWNRLLALANERCLLNLACVRVLQLRDALAEGAASRWTAEAGRQRQWNRILQNVAEELVDDLGAAAIPAVSYKGHLLSQTLHGDALVRDSKDVDLLVPTARATDAIVRLIAKGYELKAPATIRDLTPLFFKNYREVTLVTLGGAIEIDVHWQISSPWIHQHLNQIPWEEMTAGDSSKQVTPRGLSSRGVAAALIANVSNSHFIEIKAAADIVLALSHDRIRGEILDLLRVPQRNGNRPITSSPIEVLASATRLPTTTVQRHMFTTPTSERNRAVIWLNHIAKLRTVSEVFALAKSAMYRTSLRTM